MHICFLTSEYPKSGFPHGGVGTFVKTIGYELLKKGIKVSVVGINYIEKEETENDNGIMVYRCKPRRIKGLTWFLNSRSLNKRISEIHKTNAIDIVEGAELSLAFIQKITGVKYLIRLHGGHHFFAESENRGINKWKGFQEKRSFRKADAFIGVSNYAIEHTGKYLNFGNKPVRLIHYPINVKHFYKSNQTKTIPFRVAFAGTVCEKKGVRQLIEAMIIITNDFPDTNLFIYGRDWKFKDGRSYIIFLKEQFPENIFEKIHFEGAVDFSVIPEKYELAEVCVFPSHMETTGLVAPEAMLMEKPVVFTKFGPGPEVIRDGVTGLLCDPLNPADIAEKVAYLFKNKHQAREIGKNARLDILQRFSPENIVIQNIDFYRSLL